MLHRALTLCFALVLGMTLSACGGGSSGPQVTGIAPFSGGTAGGTLLTITGAGFGSVSEVRVGGVAATELVVVDGSTLTCRTPAAAEGPADVTVLAGGREASYSSFNYYPGPQVTGLSQDRGSLAGGETVTITGSGFEENAAGACSVSFGDVAVPSLVVISDTEIECQLAAQPLPATLDVHVENNNGIGTMVGGFEIVPVPVVTAITANTGPAGGHTNVTIQGDHLDGGVQQVLFGGQAATHVAVVDANTMTCRTPPGAEGTVAVSVSTFGGSDTLASAYSYTTWSPDDPLFANQWHLENTAQVSPATVGEDANVRPVWNWGYTGKDVRIAVVDDGMELAHEDLVDNVVVGANWDYGDDDNDPTRGAHGTAVAGVSAGVGQNQLGGVGAAPEARLVGYAVLVSGQQAADFADALGRNLQDNDIFNNSWGAPAISNGVFFGFSGTPQSFYDAVDSGITQGRDGKGCVYFKSAGNSGDVVTASYDATNSIRGINVIGSVNTEGQQSSYSQVGPSLLVCAPSNDGGHAGITTVDRTGGAGYAGGSYTSGFGGTSSACPLVSGVAALILEARPELTWWEVSLVIALSARRNDAGNADWVQNGAGHWINDRYGFGVIDAEAAVNMARTWVPRTGLVSTTQSTNVGLAVPLNDATGVSSTITIGNDTGITNLHTATISVDIDHARCTDLTVILTSPDGTESRFCRTLIANGGTTATNRMRSIPLLSRRHLGETVAGDWTLTISEGANNLTSTWTAWTLTLEGEGTSTATRQVALQQLVVPEAPVLGDANQVTWWTGQRWELARQQADLVAAWAVPGMTSLAEAFPDALDGVLLREGDLTIWRIRQGVESGVRDAIRAAGQPVYRDGLTGEGALRSHNGRIVVRFAAGATDSVRSDLAQRFGLQTVRVQAGVADAVVFDVPHGEDAIALARALLASDDVVHAEVDWWQVRRFVNVPATCPARQVGLHAVGVR